MLRKYTQVAAAAAITLGTSYAQADCFGLPNWVQLKNALELAVATETSGLNLDMWATVVDRDGVVCAVAFSGNNRASQWPGSRVISAQKANTANAFSLDGELGRGGPPGALAFPAGLALSTANLYSAVQPGGSLYGLQHSNPVNTAVAYGGNSAFYGTRDDFMVGKKIGGVNVFGGGLALYNQQRKLVGAVGVSGDTSCADHMIGWRVRSNLFLDYLGGVSGVGGGPTHPDNIVYLPGGAGFGHPTCINTATVPGDLPAVRTAN
jgi:uncharacterized protein GlcG (DUF336 family)